jgi:hypothetical protein
MGRPRRYGLAPGNAGDVLASAAAILKEVLTGPRPPASVGEGEVVARPAMTVERLVQDRTT